MHGYDVRCGEVGVSDRLSLSGVATSCGSLYPCVMGQWEYLSNETVKRDTDVGASGAPCAPVVCPTPVWCSQFRPQYTLSIFPPPACSLRLPGEGADTACLVTLSTDRLSPV